MDPPPVFRRPPTLRLLLQPSSSSKKRPSSSPLKSEQLYDDTDTEDQSYKMKILTLNRFIQQKPTQSRIRPCRNMTALFCLVVVLIYTSCTNAQFSSLSFTKNFYNGSIQENCLPRTYVRGPDLMGVSLDSLPPSTQIQYTITSGDPEGFFAVEDEEIGGFSIMYIRTKTGLRDVLNRERRSKYTLNIQAEARSQYKSVSSLPASTVVRIYVEDTNDNIPLFYPDSYSVDVPEDLSINTALVHVEAQDADSGINGEVYYFLDNPRNDLFSVHPITGKVTVTKPLHTSRTSNYFFKVFAKDRGLKPSYMKDDAIAEAEVRVSVLRINNASPQIVVRHLPQVIEHAHAHIYAIMTVTDSDEGNGGTIRSVEVVDGDPDRIFSISRGTADNEYNLIVLKLLDRELSPAGFNLTVRATDAGVPPRSVEVSLPVTIADINDHFPVFLQPQYEVTVNEEAPPKTPVVRVAASDTDFGKNAVVNFRILAGNHDGKFEINSKTGMIYTTGWLDAESKSHYSLTVGAIDQASSSVRKQSSAKVIIKVLDANDNAPDFVVTDEEVSIDENKPAGTYVTKVSASDIDSSENGFISYSITNMNQIPFTIDPFDGVIRTSKVLDYETERRSYTITVRASDWGQPFKRERETTIRVKINDINDNKPKFLGTDCSGWLVPTMPMGSRILSLGAVDLDANSIVTFGIQSADNPNCWSLDRNSGVLSLNCDLWSTVLQNSNSKTMKLNITASDGRFTSDVNHVTLTVVDHLNNDLSVIGSQKVKCKENNNVFSQYLNLKNAQQENTTPRVPHYGMVTNVEGYNVHAPTFASTELAAFEVSENTEVGSVLFSVHASDLDFGYDGRVVYSIISGDVDSVFEINMITGELFISSALDREGTSEYLLNITAFDLGFPHKSSSKNVSIKILDVNDNAPQFTKASYSLHLPENTRNGTSVAQLIAVDADEGENALVSYELVTKVEEFYLDPIFGILYIMKPLDRETVPEYELKVRAWDNGKIERRFSVTRVFVTVLDVNDCAPDFGAGNYVTITVPEDYPVGAVIATMKAIDRDLGAGGIVTYSLTDGNRDGSFKIDPETGSVRIATALDFEKVPLFNLTVRATDGGFPSFHADGHLIIFIQDVDESKTHPQFLHRVVRGWIKENQSPGTLVTTLPISNPDGRHLQYSVIGGSGHGYFSVNRHGEVRNLRPLDRETEAGYWLTVRTWTSTLDTADTCWLYVEVQDVNDHAPLTEEPSYRVYVPEDTAIGTPVLTLKATDGDVSEGSISYYVRSVRGRRNTENVFGEEGWGPDTDGSELFTLNRNTGTLSTAGLLDREYQSQYEVQVIVSDGELFTVTPVYVTVSDVNDNSPAFMEKHLYRFTVPAHRPSTSLGTRQPLFRVYARDLDSGANAELDYSLKGSRSRNLFKIHTKTGVILSKEDLPAGESYDIMVEVRDHGQPERSSTARVLLKVVEPPATSPGPPVISPFGTVHLMETDPPGHLVTFITATPAAGGAEDLSLWYYITDGDYTGQFSVGVDTGLLTVAKPLDRELQSYYRLTITVTDGVNSAVSELEIAILDANDHSPVFSAPVYSVTVSEDTAPGTSILTLLCRDKDHMQASPSSGRSSDEEDLQGDEPVTVLSPLYFSLQHAEAVASHQVFSVEPATGIVRVAQPLDREVCLKHLLTVSCRDRGARYNADYARIDIAVTDANDHWPVFAEESITATVSAGATVGAEVVRVMATDGDSGDSGRLSYTIMEGNEEGLFTIDPTLGIITLASELHDWSYYSQATKEHFLLVRATDHAPEPRSASVSIRIAITLPSNAPPTWIAYPYKAGGDSTSTNRHGEAVTQAGQVVEVGEWTHRGTAVAIVTASSPKTSLHYEITGGNSKSGADEEEGMFMITPASGVVSLASLLDREKCDWYNLSITATNTAGISRSTWVGIKVLDENDWSPEWSSYNYRGVVLESAEEGAPVFLLPSSSIEMEEASSTSSSSSSGRRPLLYNTDFQKPPLSPAPASELSTSNRRSLAGFGQDLRTKVKVNGRFVRMGGVGSIPSIKELGNLTHLTVTASDSDAGANGRVSYSLAESSATTKYFTLDPVTGAVRVAGSLSSLAGQVLGFSIWASDAGSPRRESVNPAFVSVYVEKVNMYAPEFGRPSYESSLHLPTITGVKIICVKAYDPDDRRGRNNTLSKLRRFQDHVLTPVNYALEESAEKYKFKLDSDTGCLYVKDADIERGKHEVTVVASDSVHTNTVQVFVLASDKLENSLEFMRSKYFAHVLENSTKQLNLLVITVKNKSKNHNIVYSILNSNDYVRIKPTSGVLQTTGKPFDREENDHFTLIIQARELETNRTGNVEVTIAILDVNDNKPVFVGEPYHALLSTTAQAGHVVTQVRAVDPDAGEYGRLQYELLQGSSDTFSVNSTSGEVLLQQTLPIPGNTLTVTVAVYDGGTPPLSATARVLIRVVSAGGPMFSQRVYGGKVSEDASVGTPVTRVSAESSSGTPLIYTIVAGDPDVTFDLHYGTGVLQVASPLDFETQRWHNLTVRARDPATGGYADAIVTVEVSDVNDNAPLFLETFMKASVSEAAVPGTFVAQVTASDADTGPNAMVHYTCSTGCDTFSVHQKDGTILLTSPLDADNDSTSLHVTVVASDGGSPSLSSTATLLVKVDDFNDNPPVWTQQEFRTSVSPDATTGQVLTAVSARDPDVSDIGKLRYLLLTGDPEEIFHVDSVSGAVSLRSPEKLTTDQHHMTLSVTDGVHAVTAPLTVNVLPCNHHPPRFLKQTWEGAVLENSEALTSVLQVRATDPDAEEYGEVVYSIIGDKERELFDIDENGNLMTLAPLDREDTSTFTLIISAADGGDKRDFAKVTIAVQDANDNKPVFALPEYRASVVLTTQLGTPILTVKASDSDLGANSTVSYEIYQTNSTEALELFQMDSHSGTVTLRESAMALRNEVYQFFVRASDDGIPSLHSDVPTTIYIVDSDEDIPHCDNAFARYFLPEDASKGTVVTSLWTNGPLPVRYTLLSDPNIDRISTAVTGRTRRSPFEPTALEISSESDTSLMVDGEGDLFEVTDSGDLVLRKHLDHELQRTHTVTVLNETLDTPATLDYMTIVVVVMDVNDNAPVFRCNSYSTSIAENTAVGSTVLMLRADDKDGGNNGQVEYFLSSAVPEEIRNTFHVSSQSGAITLIQPLDRERQALHSFEVEARDQGAVPLASITNVVINVKDYNDNPPVFQRTSYTAAVPEDAEVGDVVFVLSVADRDEVNTPLHFFITSGDPEANFAVESSGQVLVADGLDREKRSQYSLGIAVTDGRFTSNTTLVIRVIDVNDNGPRCEESTLVTSVSEDVLPGHPIITAEAVDADEFPQNRIRYVLEGDGADHFSIGEQTGEVVTAKTLDLESKENYELIVRASDWEHSDWQCVLRLFISLTDVNDNPPRLVQSNFTATVPEDAPVNAVVAKIRAADPDLGVNSRVHYTLLDSAEGHFSIDSQGGLVTLSKPLDREFRDSYVLTVAAADYGNPPLQDTAIITVTVADINDNPPEFVRTLQQVTVNEDTKVGVEITRVMATSRDIGVNAKITYSVQHGALPSFVDVHPQTGVVTLSQALDYESLQSLLVTITATDGGTPPLSATSLLNITVLDINDNPPVFTQESYTGRASEGAPLGEYIAQLSAHDRDSGDLGRVRFTITSGDPHGRFSINPRSGALTLASHIDREQTPFFSLIVTAQDGGIPPLSATVAVNVIVGDINDNAPIFSRYNYSAILQEDKKIGHSVVRMQVSDADDAGNGAPFTWEIVDSSPASTDVSTAGGVFAMDQDGVIKLSTNRLNHKVQNQYRLLVRVWDSGSPPLFSETTVHVKVVEKSKYPPTIFPLHVTVFSYRTAYKGGIIGKVNAMDKDPYDSLKYTLLSYGSKRNHYSSSALEYFDIDNEDGTLVAVTPLDSGVYHVNVSVTDGKFLRSVDVTVDVRVLTQHMLDSAVIIRMGPITPEEFLMRYKDVLVKAIAGELYKSERQIHIISLQASNHMPDNEISNSKVKRDASPNLDILMAIEKDADVYFTRNETVAFLQGKENRIRRKLYLDEFTIMKSSCIADDQCSYNGDCIDVIDLKDDIVMPLNTRLTSIVALRFEQKFGCMCHQGFGGETCEELVNACGHRPCSKYEICTPTDLTTKGFLCHCPIGFAGQKCEIDTSKCHNLSCYYPIRPLSFRGKSYAQYTIPHQSETNAFRLSLHMRTRHPVGVISYISGKVDFSILEVIDGYVQYRWNCGSGEGLARSLNRINDNKWHRINVTRHGTLSLLFVDGEKASGIAPGESDMLNIESDFMYIGASISGNDFTLSPERGFVGCLDEISMDGSKLPLTLANAGTSDASLLKRFVNIELSCPATLPTPGVCSTHPCLNGGTCVELNKEEYECKCSKRYTGEKCENDMAPCSSSPCLNDGVCITVGYTYSCNCPAKLSGLRCEYGVFCNPNPCKNGGRCEEGVRGPVCKCHHFSGDRCQYDINECSQNPCHNGGTCLNFHGGFKCLCPSNVSGEFCNDVVSSASSFNLHVEEMVVILAVVLAFGLVVFIVVFCARRRCRRNKHQQNNSVKLTSHVKNDLKSFDKPHRNSKICNVEADQLHMQYPPVPQQRPLSLTLSGDDPLKHWTDSPSAAANHHPVTQEAYELDVINRPSADGADVIIRQPNDYVSSDPNINRPTLCQPNIVKLPPSQKGGAASNFLYPPPAEQNHVNVSQKPWDHRNNLNDSYFTPVKEVYGAMAVTDAAVSSAAINNSGQRIDDYDVRPSTPLLSFKGGLPSPNISSAATPTAVYSPPQYISAPAGGGGRGVVCDPQHLNYQEGVVTFRGPSPHLPVPGSSHGGGGRSLNIERPADDSIQEDHNNEESFESRPLLAYTSQQLPEVVLCSYDSASSTPLLRTASPSSGSIAQHSSLPAVNKALSYQDIVQANNISLDSSDDAINENPVPVSASKMMPPNVRYNIMAEDVTIDTGEKISNVASTTNSAQTLNSCYSNAASKIRNDRQTNTEPRKKNFECSEVQQNRLGNPRSRRPIVKGDYGRVSDLSFLSTNTDSEIEGNGTVSDFHYSEDEDDDQLLGSRDGAVRVSEISNVYV